MLFVSLGANKPCKKAHQILRAKIQKSQPPFFTDTIYLQNLANYVL